jgi:hypothetical protein
LEQNRAIFIYEKIDRKDKRETHKETYVYTRENTRELKWDFVTNRICISGYPEVLKEYTNKTFDEEISNELVHFLLVMPDGNIRTQIIGGLQDSLKCISL